MLDQPILMLLLGYIAFVSLKILFGRKSPFNILINFLGFFVTLGNSSHLDEKNKFKLIFNLIAFRLKKSW